MEISYKYASGNAWERCTCTYQIYERKKLPATAVCLMRGHVYGFVIAEDGKIREEYRYSEDLWWDERHFPSPVVFPSREISCWHRDAVVRWGGGDVGGGGGCAREVVAIVTSIAACAEQLVGRCSLCPRMLVVSRRWLVPALSFGDLFCLFFSLVSH